MKIIKFDLPINGIKAKNLEELRDNLTDEIIGLARSGQLARWFTSRQLEDKAKAVTAVLSGAPEDKALFLALCEILEVEVHLEDVNAIFDAPPAAGSEIIKNTKNIWESKIIDVRLPTSIGSTGFITEWKVKIGAIVAIKQIIACVETDRGKFKITTPIAGIVIEILQEYNETIIENQLIAIIYAS